MPSFHNETGIRSAVEIIYGPNVQVKECLDCSTKTYFLTNSIMFPTHGQASRSLNLSDS